MADDASKFETKPKQGLQKPSNPEKDDEGLVETSPSNEDLLKYLYEEADKIKNDIIPSSTSSSAPKTQMFKDIFGEKWDGNFVDGSIHVERYATEIFTKIQYYKQLSTYLSNANLQTQANFAVQKLGLSDIQNKLNSLTQSYNGITQSISNFGNFGFSVKDVDSFNKASAMTLNNMDATLNQVENLLQNADALQGYIEKAPELFENGLKTVQETAKNFKETIENGISDISSLCGKATGGSLDKFPESVKERFKSLDLVQNTMKVPLRIFNHLQATIDILMTIRCPSNFKTAIEQVRKLKDAVKEMRNAQQELQRGTQIIKNIKDNIEKGNYLGLLQNAREVCFFVQKAPTYASQYPRNNAYTTASGITVQFDDKSEGGGRINVRNPMGTELEVSPNGDTLAFSKADIQLVADKNIEMHTKADQKVQVDNLAHLKSKNAKFESDEKIDISAKDTHVVTEKAFDVDANDVTMKLKNMLTIIASSSISISSKQEIIIASDASITLDAPSITIGTGRTALVYINAASGSIANSAQDTFSVMSKVVYESGSDNYTATSENVNIDGATTNIFGTPLNLN